MKYPKIFDNIPNVLLLIYFLSVVISAAYVYLMPNPILEYFEVNVLWEYGNFNRIIYANWPSSFGIYFLCIIYLINWKITPDVKPIPKRERIENLESQVSNLELQLRIARGTIDRKVEKLVTQDAILQYLKNKMCPNCLAAVEEYLVSR